MSKHSARRTWIIERVTAIALIPLCLWLLINLVQAVGSDLETATAFIANPVNAILLAIFIIFSFWHGALGIEVVLEDYVHDLKKRKTSICIVNLLCSFLAAVSLVAIAKLALA